MRDDQSIAREGCASIPCRLAPAVMAPRVGGAMTRLGRLCSAAATVSRYQAVLVDRAGRVAAAPFPVGWYATPANAWRQLALRVGWRAREPQIVFQGTGTWTTRQRQRIRGAPAWSEDGISLIAWDAPHVTVDIGAAAFRILDQHDGVIGPVYDGWHPLPAGACALARYPPGPSDTHERGGAGDHGSIARMRSNGRSG